MTQDKKRNVKCTQMPKIAKSERVAPRKLRQPRSPLFPRLGSILGEMTIASSAEALGATRQPRRTP